MICNICKTKHCATLFFLLILLILPPIVLGAEEILLDDYEKGLAPQWKEKSFHGNTEYSVIRENNMAVVKAVSRGTASGYFYKLEYAPQDNPILSWSWKIDNIISKGDATRKEGDDYPARVYVIFPSFFFWKTKAINYIWANRLPKGTFIFSTYTTNDVMIAVESGAEYVGSWRVEERDVVADYIRAFGEPPGKVGAIAIMTDTDNTKETATAYYGPIRIRSKPK